MGFLVSIAIVLLSFLSTGIMIYIATASPIGPWMEPTIVLCAFIFFSFFGRAALKQNNLIYAVAGGSIGGIIATAIGSSFPTLFFLNPVLFNDWMAHPFFFVSILGLLSLSASLYGFLLADLLEDHLIDAQSLSFPIGEIAYGMIAAKNQIKKVIQLISGLILTFIFSLLQQGIAGFKALIPQGFTLLSSYSIAFANTVLHTPALIFDCTPSWWAIGFITGQVIAIPLLCGVISRIVILDPINVIFFPSINSMLFNLSFCTGMIVLGSFNSFISMPKSFLNSFNMLRKNKLTSATNYTYFFKQYRYYVIGAGLLTIGMISFLTYLEFPFLAQLFLLGGTTLCTYEMCIIAGKIGLAQLGRFATFVMVPAMIIFKLTSVHITFVATFVEVCCGVAVDVLFGRKMSRMGNASKNSVRKAQLMGIAISSIIVSIIFWFLVKRFALGSGDLFAQRSQSRALLVQTGDFNLWVIAIGAAFGYIIKYIKINPMMVLGGILMPLNVSLGLITGGLGALLIKNKEQWYPFWSGVFAAHSLWMIYQAFFYKGF